jgi:Zn-dependent protease
LRALLWYGAFVVSVTAHEAAHALAAYLGGDPTAYRAGQVSLNPVPPGWERRHPRRAAWMAAAGPGANFALAALALLALRAGLELGWFHAPDRISFGQLVEASALPLDVLGRILSILLVLNVILGLFNLIPLPPLDGATAVTLVLPEDTALRFREVLRTGSFGLIGLLVAWWLFVQAIGPVFGAILRLVHPGVPYR